MNIFTILEIREVGIEADPERGTPGHFEFHTNYVHVAAVHASSAAMKWRQYVKQRGGFKDIEGAYVCERTEGAVLSCAGTRSELLAEEEYRMWQRAMLRPHWDGGTECPAAWRRIYHVLEGKSNG